MRRALSLLGLLATVLASDAQAVQVQRLSPPGESYIDPEILQEYDLLTFQTGTGEIWVARLDAETGLFVTADGKDLAMDSGAEHPSQTLNGPEFGLDKYGWAVFYTKLNAGVAQVWRAQRSGSETSAAALTVGSIRRQSALASKDRRAASVRVSYARGSLQGMLGWFDEDAPQQAGIVDSVDVGIRWIEGTRRFVYVKQTGPSAGQLALYDTDTASETVITADGGTKTFPFGWHAPDHDGALLVATILDDTLLAVYRDTGGAAWERIDELAAPAGSAYGVFGSPEALVVGGTSYLSVVCKAAGSSYVPGEVWILGAAPASGERFALRVDDGTPGVKRSDPETFLGTHEVFVYYNVVSDTGEFEVHRSATGIPTDPGGMLTEHRALPSVTDPSIDGLDAPHQAYLPTYGATIGRLLLYFPGTNATPWMYREFLRTAAELGYHAVGLTYENTASINLTVCPPGTTDTTCHRRAREEIWYGVDRHAAVDVDPANSILHRAARLLRHLDARHPGEGWGAYLTAEDSLVWPKVVTAGHSQGGNHAGFGARRFAVSRSVMISCTDWVYPGRTADWIRTPGPTPASAFYGFIHAADASIYATIPATWTDFGMFDFGPLTFVDGLAPPYGDSHTLVTNAVLAEPQPDETDYHNSTCVDFVTPLDAQGEPLLAPVWRYLLNTSFTTSAGDAGPGGGESAGLRVQPTPATGRTNIVFTLERPGQVELVIYDITGRRVATLHQGTLPGGRHVMAWNGREQGGRPLGAGVYFVRLEGEGASRLQKLVLLR